MQVKQITYLPTSEGLITEQVKDVTPDTLVYHNGLIGKAGDIASTVKNKITHTVFPYKIEGIPMIGEVKRLSADEMVEENFRGLTDAMNGNNDLSHFYKLIIKECILSYATQPKALITDAAKFSCFNNELGKYSIVYDRNGENETIVGETGNRDIANNSCRSLNNVLSLERDTLKGNGFSEDDILSSMWATIGFMKRNPTSVTEDYKSFIKEYIQSLTNPTSAVFTDGEFIKFNY